MNAVRVSPKFQVVIPAAVRDELHIQAGEIMQVIPYENRIEFIPVVPARKLRGFLKGINTDVPRDGDRA